MKICLFIASLERIGGGPSRSVPILAKGISFINIDVTLMTIKSEDMNLHIVEDTDVKLVIIPKDISYSALQKIILDGKFDIIHNQMIWTPIYHKVVNIALKHNIPYMTTPRGTLEPWAYTGQGWIKTIKKKVAMMLYQSNDIEKANCILATSDMECNNIRKLGFKVPIAVVPNGIEIDNYPCRALDSFEKVKKQVVFLSRIHPKKGLEILINAWENIHKSFSDWAVIIVGNGDVQYIKKLNQLIQQKGLGTCVKILPPAFGEEKYNLYAESALFCLPTFSENFGMVIAEALSCGVPVITTKGTPWKILESSKSGWWIELSQENIEHALLDAISRDNKELFDMGQRGSVMVRENFYYVEVAKKLKSVYEWILSCENKPIFVY